MFQMQKRKVIKYGRAGAIPPSMTPMEAYRHGELMGYALGYRDGSEWITNIKQIEFVKKLEKQSWDRGFKCGTKSGYKRVVETMIPQLYAIKANISPTLDGTSRKQVEELIEELEDKIYG